MQIMISHLVIFLSVFILTIIMGKISIPILTRLKLRQTIRDDGPNTHLVKMGTPTMGGVIFLIPITLFCIYIARYDTRILSLLLVTLGFGAVGFIDDMIKIVKKSKDGLNPKQKMLGLLLIAVLFSFYMVRLNIVSEINIPFMGLDYNIDIGYFLIPLTILVLISTTNAVNITDGLDGLVSGIIMIIMIFFSAIGLLRDEWDYIRLLSVAVAGGSLGFLMFNLHPAKVFMGDTGSLALGGAAGAICILMGMPFLIVIAGIVFVVESISVIIQVVYYKKYKKRVFKMAPLHHHYELSGWKETKIVAFFWAVTFIFCMIALFSLRIKLF